MARSSRKQGGSVDFGDFVAFGRRFGASRGTRDMRRNTIWTKTARSSLGTS